MHSVNIHVLNVMIDGCSKYLSSSVPSKNVCMYSALNDALLLFLLLTIGGRR